MKQTMGLIQNILTIWKRIGVGGLFVLLTLILFTVACSAEKQPAEESIDVTVYLPQTISVEQGGTYSFQILGKGNAKMGDVVNATSLSGKIFSLHVIGVNPKGFDVSIPDDFVQGKYTFSLVRGGKQVQLGSAQVNVTYNGADAKLDPGTTVYGWVRCGDAPIADVVVSDGYEVVKTDKDGLYQMASQKKNPYVFVSIPSGYSVISDGVLPLFYVYLTKPADTPERADFELFREEGQKNHTMLFFGDMHLANRTNDRKQFASFVSDVNSFLSTASGPVYAMTLGDMTWDQYWYSNSYEFAQYLADVNGIKGLSIFHTIGNHDHDMNATGDWFTVVKYKERLCPNYFSFNIGNIHYVSIDNILCKNTAASTTNPDVRKYSEKVAPEVIDWLKKDLSFVDKSMHIVATAHASIYSQTGGAALDNASEFVSCFAGYDVDFVTGHSHKIWNVDKRASNKVYEHNTGAVCATWWWTGYYTPTLNMGQDGAPGGWRIARVSGNDIDWQFKGTQRDAGYQFRTYDRNKINITASEFAPSATGEYAESFNALAAACGWYGASSANEVYINIWDYDPSWTITVTEKETGSTLQASRVTVCDPLYLIAYSAKRYNVNKNPTFSPFATNHIFKVKASSATSTLDITVKDPYGRTYTQTMTRPKNFSLSVYANE